MLIIMSLSNSTGVLHMHLHELVRRQSNKWNIGRKERVVFFDEDVSEEC